MPLGSQLKQLLPAIAVYMLYHGQPHPIQEKLFMLLDHGIRNLR